MKAVVPVVHRDVAVAQTLRRGLPRRSVRVVRCRTPEALARYLSETLVDAAVVDVLTPGWAIAAFALARRYPRIPIFGFSAFRADHGRVLVACRGAGLRGVFVQGVDEPVAGEVIAAGTASRRRAELLADGPRLLRLTEPIQRAAWDEVLLRAGAPMTTADVARAMGHTREHVSREFAAGGAPNLKRVIDLVRAAWAADLLGNPAHTVDSAARILGYSSGSHLAGTARRVAGVTAHGLRSIGPRGVLQRFLRGRTRSRL